MQASTSTIRTFFSSSLKTACGQTSAHVPHPLHFSASTVKVTTPGRYRIANIVKPISTSRSRYTKRPTSHRIAPETAHNA